MKAQRYLQSEPISYDLADYARHRYLMYDRLPRKLKKKYKTILNRLTLNVNCHDFIKKINGI
jgi:hypothetical protein